LFSDRVDFDFETNQLTKILDKKRLQGTEVVDLTQSNPTRVGIHYPEEELKEALVGTCPISYTPDPRGLWTAREAVTRYYSNRSCEVEPEDVLLTASTSEAYAFLFKLLTNAGESILIPRPSYPLFEYLAALESVRAIPYALHFAERWGIDVMELQRHLEQAPRALLTVNPNNPTGSFISKADWSKIGKLCGPRSIPVICDEVFFDYPLDHSLPSFDPLPHADLPSFFLNGLSKTAGLPQMKLSWIVIRGPKSFRKHARTRLELISDTFLSVQTGVQEALGSILELAPQVQSQILERVRTNLAILDSAVTDTPLDCLRAEGGWNAVVRIPRTLTEEEWVTTLLEEANVLVHPGYFYDFPQEGFLVVSLLPQPYDFNRGVEDLLSFFTLRS
jgi:aspartate/methionine/tyrosine aminotransferase